MKYTLPSYVVQANGRSEKLGKCKRWGIRIRFNSFALVVFKWDNILHTSGAMNGSFGGGGFVGEERKT